MSGIYLVAAIVLALVVPAKAQDSFTYNWPKTIRIVDNATGELVGTHTITGNVIYIRDKAGELVSTVTINRDGSRTSRDPSGKVKE